MINFSKESIKKLLEPTCALSNDDVTKILVNTTLSLLPSFLQTFLSSTSDTIDKNQIKERINSLQENIPTIVKDEIDKLQSQIPSHSMAIEANLFSAVILFIDTNLDSDGIYRIQKCLEDAKEAQIEEFSESTIVEVIVDNDYIAFNLSDFCDKEEFSSDLEWVSDALQDQDIRIKSIGYV